jgi:hypothetical protein
MSWIQDPPRPYHCLVLGLALPWVGNNIYVQATNSKLSLYQDLKSPGPLSGPRAPLPSPIKL